MKLLGATLRLAWSARVAVLCCSILPFTAFFALSYAAEHYLTPALIDAMRRPTSYYGAAYALWTSEGDLLRFALEAAAIAAVLASLAPCAERLSRRWRPGRSAFLLFARLIAVGALVLAWQQTVRAAIEMLPDPAVHIPIYESLGRALLSALDRLLAFTGLWPVVALLALQPARRLVQGSSEERGLRLLDRAALAALLVVADRASSLVLIPPFRVLVEVIAATSERGLLGSWWLWVLALACFILRELIFVALVVAILKLRFQTAAGVPRMAPAA